MREKFIMILTNIKMMITNPAIIIVTILFTMIVCSILGKIFGLVMGPFSIYQIMFYDKNNRWNGEDWVDKDGISWKDKRKDPEK